MFSAETLCLFVCQYDNFQMIKHRMTKLDSKCIVTKFRPISNFKVTGTSISPSEMRHFDLYAKCEQSGGWTRHRLSV